MIYRKDRPLVVPLIVIMCPAIVFWEFNVTSTHADVRPCSTDGIVCDEQTDQNEPEEVREAMHLRGGAVLVIKETVVKMEENDAQRGDTIHILARVCSRTSVLVIIGSEAALYNCLVKIAFQPNAIPDSSDTFDVFGPTPGVDLHTALSKATQIETPTDWRLDRDTGVLSFLPFSDCITGPQVPASKACADNYDMDADGNVDLRDFAAHQASFGQ